MNRILLLSVAACLAGSAVVAEDAAPVAAAGDVLRIDLASALRMAAESNLVLRGGGLAAAAAATRVREESGRFDPVFDLNYSHALDTNTQPLDPFGSRPPSSVIKSDDYEASLSGFLPNGAQYRAGLSAQNQRGTFNNFADNYYTFLGVSVIQPLLRESGPSAALTPLRLARAQRAAARWEFQRAVNDTLTRTIFAFHNLAFSQAALRVSERSVSLVEQLVRDNERRHERGAMSTQDVVEARARAARRRDSVYSARLSVVMAENDLKRLIFSDLAPMADRHLELQFPEIEPPASDQLRSFAAEALEQRPDYQQAVVAVEQRRLELGLQRNRVRPSLDLVASYGYNGSDASFGESFRQAREAKSDSYSVGAVVSVPLLNRSALARRRAAELDLRRAEVALDDLGQEVQRQLDDGLATIDIAGQRVSATQEARELAQQSLTAEEKRLRAGTSSTFLVLEQQEILAASELQEHRAIADLAIAIADFHRLCGRTLMAYGLDPEMVAAALDQLR